MTGTTDSGVLLRDDETAVTKSICDASTHAYLSCGFTVTTCRELLHLLTAEQLDRELLNKYEHSVVLGLKTIDEKRLQLGEHFNSLLANRHDEQQARLEELTDSFSCRVAQSECVIAELNGKLKEATHAIQELLTPRTKATSTEVTIHATPLSNGTTPRIEPGTSDSSTDKDLNFVNIHDGTPFANFTVDELERSTEYDRTFSNRSTAHYGPVDYSYSGAFHKARPISSNPYLFDIFERVKLELPGVELNSALINKYDGPNSKMPFHQDNEPCIVKDSTIVTVSLGQTRDLSFRRITGTYKMESVEVTHGQMYTMSRSSQDLYDHGILPSRSSVPNEQGVRLSITFRNLVEPEPRASPAESPASAKTVRRVLILSDSKNRGFDTQTFKEPIVCHRKDMFYLKDLVNHIDEICKHDVILVSAGINDIMKERATPTVIRDHMRWFSELLARRAPDTYLLFDAISNVALSADRHGWLNQAINATNRMVFQYSARVKNLRVFDTLQFGRTHLALDGIHLTKAGKTVLGASWVHSTMIILGLRRGQLPLRQEYKNFLHRVF